jgi:hypothetical protein
MGRLTLNMLLSFAQSERELTANATCGSIRLKLLQIGALVRVSVRRVRIAMASAHPCQHVFALAHARLCYAAS